MKIQVAIFEDNRALRESLRQLIDSAEDMMCTGAYGDAIHVVRQLQLNPADVVLMDINMPTVHGIEAVGLIKKKFPDIRVIMQTVFEDKDKIFAAICAGASGYLLKKTTPAKLLDAIREIQAGGATMTSSVASKVMEMVRAQNPDIAKEFIALSEREKEILSLLVKGKSYKEIAATCSISFDTVCTHVRHIYEKLQVHSKSEAVAKAINQKLV